MLIRIHQINFKIKYGPLKIAASNAKGHRHQLSYYDFLCWKSDVELWWDQPQPKRMDFNRQLRIFGLEYFQSISNNFITNIKKNPQKYCVFLAPFTILSPPKKCSPEPHALYATECNSRHRKHHIVFAMVFFFELRNIYIKLMALLYEIEKRSASGYWNLVFFLHCSHLCLNTIIYSTVFWCLCVCAFWCLSTIYTWHWCISIYLKFNLHQKLSGLNTQKRRSCFSLPLSAFKKILQFNVEMTIIPKSKLDFHPMNIPSYCICFRV